MRKRKVLLFVLLFVISGFRGWSASGDTTWVQAHDNVWLDWYNDFDADVSFPGDNVSYRRILMVFTLGKYICPDNPQYCSDWDYTVRTYIMTPGGDTLQLGKLITPYAKGDRMPADWKGEYVFDVTDYYPVLKNTGKVRVHYSGYSGGFTANVRFAFIEGRRTRDVVRIDRLWHGDFKYGDAAEPIESAIAPVQHTVPAGTTQTVLKFNITGHGGDDVNCAEFCKKHYRVLVNNVRIDERAIWRDDCGLNHLYPQSGTWIYSRGNWCPGDLVLSNEHPLAGLKPGDPFSVDIDFDPHQSTTNTPNRYPASYLIEGTLFHYGPVNKSLDISLEDVIAPTDEERYFRENARCGTPVVRVKNTGNTPVFAIHFEYGVNDVYSGYTWEGLLDSEAEAEIALPEPWELRVVSGNNNRQKFTVKIKEVNGKSDQDIDNNELSTVFTAAPKWPARFVVSLRTNNSVTAGVSQSGWAIYDLDDHIVKERKNLGPNTNYTDTLSLGPGCYRLEVQDAGCDGLSWWANPGAGKGSFSVRGVHVSGQFPLNGYFNGDFGCGFTQYFTTDWPTDVERVMPGSKVFMNVYPNPAGDRVHVSVNGADQGHGMISIRDVYGRVIARERYAGYEIVFNTSAFANGTYMIAYTREGAEPVRMQEKFVVNNVN